MTAIVAVETVLLVLLVVLVAGLLRSHAEILRRLSSLGPGTEADAAIPGPPRQARTAAEAVATAVSGMTPAGDAVTLAFEGESAQRTLLAFLTSGCSTCAGFWETLGERRLPADVQTVIVARGSELESPSRLHKLAPAGVPVVMSSQAWTDYHVPGAPYFVLVDQEVRGEGVATTWQALASLVGDAIEDELIGGDGPGGAGTRRAAEVEATLAAGGIGRGHPSLYPAGRGVTESGGR